MNARDRGTLIHRLADLMEQHKEELATIETIGIYIYMEILCIKYMYISFEMLHQKK